MITKQRRDQLSEVLQDYAQRFEDLSNELLDEEWDEETENQWVLALGELQKEVSKLKHDRSLKRYAHHF